MQMRAGGTAGHAREGNDLALTDMLADMDFEFGQVQKVGAEAEAVVEQDGAAGQVEVGLGEGDDAGGRRSDGCALRYGDIHAGVRGLGLAVVDALIAEAAADVPLRRPAEAAEEIFAIIVTVACGGDGGLFAFDPCGEFGWRVYCRGRYAVDALDRPVARRDGYACVLLMAIGSDHAHHQLALFVATDTEDRHTVFPHMHGFARDIELTTRFQLDDNQAALR